MLKTRPFFPLTGTKTSQTIALGVIALGFAGCSADVTRFSYIGENPPNDMTASIPPGDATRAAPLERVTRAPLNESASRPLTNPAPSGQASSATWVNVTQGDTLYSLSRRYNVSPDEIAAVNNLQRPYSINPGQSLMIPSPGVPDTAWNSGKTRSTNIYKNATAPNPRNPVFTKYPVKKGSVHIVRHGETLYGISREYGVRTMDMVHLNKIGHDASIKPGQRLLIPMRHQAAAKIPPARVAYAPPARIASIPKPRRKPALGPFTTADAGTRAPVVKARKVRTASLTTPVIPRQKSSAVKSVKITKLPKPAQRSHGKFRWPVKGRIISDYGKKKNGSRNDGINFAVPEGASIKAAENGVIAYAGNELKGYGNLVLIRHADDWVTAYAHNSRLLVKRGQKVRRGDIIAKAGQSGSVERPQLHFEVRKGARAVDPRQYMAGA